MEKTILNVDGMACEHCVKAVTTAVTALPGIDAVSVDLKAKTVTVQYDPSQSPLPAIQAAIEEQGYDIVA